MRAETAASDKEWCCQTGLNCRPLHYQWSALPLSYGSMPGSQGIGRRGPCRRPVLATRPPLAQARGRPETPPKRAKSGFAARDLLAPRQLGPNRFHLAVAMTVRGFE